MVLLAAGCASPEGTKVADIDGSKDLPAEYQDQFAVKEPVHEPAPAQAEPVSKTVKTAKGKEAKVAAPAKKAAAFQFPSRRPAKEAIWVGEKHTLEVTYFGAVAGLATLEVLPFKEVAERKVYHLKLNAKSSKLFGMFYELDDTLESFLDFNGMFSHRFNLVLHETKQTRDSVELYDSVKKKAFYWDKWNHHKKGFQEKKETTDIEAFPQDSLTSLYYLRNLPLPTGAEYEYPVVSEGKTWRLNVKVIRREMVDTVPFGKIRAVVVKPETKFGGVVRQQGDSFIWLTDDDRHFLLRIEAKVRIGSVNAKLKEIVQGSPP